MVNIAFIFPGQGSQYAGMGKDLYENQPKARSIFDEADRILNIPLTKYCFEGPSEILKQTIICQPAILTVSVALLEVMKSVLNITPSFTAGLSLGEYSALVAAGVLDFYEALVLVYKRAGFMEEEAQKVKGKMAAVLGFDKEKLKDICQKMQVEIANINCPGQIVISGKAENIDRAAGLLQNRGVRVIPLEVSGAFHSSLMANAAMRFKEVLDSVKFSQPKCKVVTNASAQPEGTVEEIKDNLYKQITSSVLWYDSVLYMKNQGVRKFYEIGPGKVLKGLIRKIDPALEVQNIEKNGDFLSEV